MTFSRVSPYASEAFSDLSLVSASVNRRLFCYTPLVQWAVAGCLPFRARWGTSISHQAHRGWERFPSSIMTTVLRTCWCMKCTCIAVLIAARPGQPSNGQLRGTPFSGNDIWKVRGPALASGVLQLRCISATLPY